MGATCGRPRRGQREPRAEQMARILCHLGGSTSMPVRPRSVWPFIAFFTALAITFASAYAWYCSRYGYWFQPPPSSNVTSRLQSLEQFTTVYWSGTTVSGAGALMARQAESRPGGGESINSGLIDRGLSPSSQDSIPRLWLVRAKATLDSAGILESGSGRYTNAKDLCGSLALGRGADSKVLLVALTGGALSEDAFFPYYEAAFRVHATGQLSILRVQHYIYDDEGSAPSWSAFCTIAVAILWGLAWGTVAIRRRIARPVPTG